MAENYTTYVTDYFSPTVEEASGVLLAKYSLIYYTTIVLSSSGGKLQDSKYSYGQKCIVPSSKTYKIKKSRSTIDAYNQPASVCYPNKHYLQADQFLGCIDTITVPTNMYR